MALVIDVSNNNGRVDFAAAKRAGVKAVIAKASEGATYTDRWFSTHRHNASVNGLHFGAYHFANPALNRAHIEAKHFCDIVERVGVKDVKPVLDLERDTHLTRDQTERWIRDFNAEVMHRLGVWPMFYSYSSYIHDMRLSRPVGNGLWLADYGPDDGHRHPVRAPRPWRRIALHQYTQHGRLPGVHGELDLSEGNLRSILAHPVRALLGV